MLLKVPLSTNKTGQHVVSYNRYMYIVESGIEYQENWSQCYTIFENGFINTTKTDRQKLYHFQN
jgi:hypothetical protein